MTSAAQDTPLGRVAILGTGLIGGSLALALKKERYASGIVGCSKTQATLESALALGIIDSGVSNPAEAVKDADMVVFCTPLSTYGALAMAIAPHLKPGAVITDAGSVKHQPSLNILRELKPEQTHQFVPGHPIAGTEKSGPEAAFAELFSGRNVILTPMPNTDRAVRAVRAMWEAAGASVMELGSSMLHDWIYATVSHNVQLLSSAYGLALLAMPDALLAEIIQHGGGNFRRFVRLTGSSPAMWQDIFIENSGNLAGAMAAFRRETARCREWLGAGNAVAIGDYLDRARRRREDLRQLFQTGAAADAEPPPGADVTDEARIWIELLPLLVAAMLLHSIPDTHDIFATGAGLRGFTRRLLQFDAGQAAAISALAAPLLRALDGLERETGAMLSLAAAGRTAPLHDALAGAGKLYSKAMSCGLGNGTAAC